MLTKKKNRKADRKVALLTKNQKGYRNDTLLTKDIKIIKIKRLIESYASNKKSEDL